MPVSVQNRTDLYARAMSALVPEGIHEAELVGVRRFANAFGERVGLVFEIVAGPYMGVRIMEAAALKARGKLTDMVRGIGGSDGSLLAAHEMIGRRCRIVVRHEQTRTGLTYAAVASTHR